MLWTLVLACREERSTVLGQDTGEVQETGILTTPTLGAINCLPDDLRGDTLAESPGNWALTEACGSDNEYLLSFDGAEEAGLAVTEAIADRHRDVLSSIDGFIGSSGGALCCLGRDELCVVVMLSTFTTPVEALPDLLVDAFAEEDACFGIKIVYMGATGPRCEETDPDCIPFPFCAEGPLGEPCCPETPPYDPQGPRIPLVEQHPDLAYLQTGSCDHDGECMSDKAIECVAYDAPTDIDTSALYCPLELDDALCGCVDDLCQWFYQQ